MICKAHALILAGCLMLTALGPSVAAQQAMPGDKPPGASTLQELVDEAARTTLARFSDRGL